MSIRLGAFLLTPNTVMVLLAGGFFWILTFRRLYPAVTPSKKVAVFLLSLACSAGAAIGMLHARIASATLHNEAFDVHLGSLGGYSGVLLAALLMAYPLHLPVRNIADSFVPGIAVGGVIARIGCMFTGCCRGYAAGITLLRPWPLYDMAALAIAYGVSESVSHKGRRAMTFFLVYGGLRFLLEFARPSAPLYGLLTVNAVFALFLCIISALLLVCFREPKNHPCEVRRCP